MADEATKERNGKWQHLVMWCLELFDDFKKSAYRSKTIESIERSKEAYNQDNVPTDDPWPGASNIVLPYTTITVDNLSPRLASGLVGKQPYLRFELPQEQTKPPPVEILENWFNNELQDQVDIEQVAIDTIDRLLQEGTCYLLPKYDPQEMVRTDYQYDEQGMPVMGADGPETTEINETIYDGGKVEFIDFNDVYIADTIDDEDWDNEPVLRKIYPTYGDLQREKSYPGYIKENIGPHLLKDETKKKLDDESATVDQDRDEATVTSKEVIECLECSVSYVKQDEDQEKEDIKNWEEERLLVTIALDCKTVIRVRTLRSVYWQNRHLLRRVTIYRKRGESYGQPVHEKIKAIQQGASKTFNLGINTAEVTLLPWFLFTEKLGLTGSEKKLIPGQGVQVDDISQIYFPKFSINPDHFFSHLQIWASFWERITSIGDLQTGMNAQKSGTTATETLAVIEEGNVKHNYQSKPIRKQFLEPLRILYDLYYQHMPLDKTFLWNKQQVPIPRQIMRRRFMFRLTGSTEMSNKLIERKENEDIYKMTMGNPLVNPQKPLEDLLKAYGRTDTAEYINPQIAQVVQVLTQMPEVAPLFMQAVQQTQMLAQQTEQQGKQQGALKAGIAVGASQGGPKQLAG
jgi:hypothetical protein